MPCRQGQVIITTHHFIVGTVGGGMLKDFFFLGFLLLKRTGRYLIYRIDSLFT